MLSLEAEGSSTGGPDDFPTELVPLLNFHHSFLNISLARHSAIHDQHSAKNSKSSVWSNFSVSARFHLPVGGCELRVAL